MLLKPLNKGSSNNEMWPLNVSLNQFSELIFSDTLEGNTNDQRASHTVLWVFPLKLLFQLCKYIGTYLFNYDVKCFYDSGS